MPDKLIGLDMGKGPPQSGYAVHLRRREIPLYRVADLTLPHIRADLILAAVPFWSSVRIDAGSPMPSANVETAAMTCSPSTAESRSRAVTAMMKMAEFLRSRPLGGPRP